MAQKTILCIPDCHFPFIHTKALKWAISVARECRPDVIVALGDSYDMWSFSSFPRSGNYITPKDELEHGRALLECMWFDLQKAAPKAKCFNLLGNHDSRIIKRVLASLPQVESLLDLRSIFHFKGVETSKAERDELLIGDIIFQHGFRTKLGDHARANAMKTVCGHSHQGGVVYQRLGKKIIWELNCGYLADPESEALSYTRQRRISNWTLGIGLVDLLGPRFIPYDES